MTYCAEDKCHNYHCDRNVIHAPDNAPASYAYLRVTEYCESYGKEETRVEHDNELD